LFGDLGSEQVWKCIAFSLGFLSCLNGTTNVTDKAGSSCKMFVDKKLKQLVSTLDLLLKGFCCPQCDIKTVNTKEQISVVDMAVLQIENVGFKNIISMVEVLPRVFLKHHAA
jgi:serine/threonine-protein kinase ATR